MRERPEVVDDRPDAASPEIRRADERTTAATSSIVRVADSSSIARRWAAWVVSSIAALLSATIFLLAEKPLVHRLSSPREC